MKNKYTILLIFLCLISSCIYISTTPYDNSTLNFSINTDEKTNENKNLYIRENNNKTKDFENVEKANINKNNTQNNNIININSADKETLKKLPGIGDSIAENIIYYRENVSLFYDISDIKNVDRIGDKTYERIKNLITTN